jgi:hypothetical protein
MLVYFNFGGSVIRYINLWDNLIYCYVGFTALSKKKKVSFTAMKMVVMLPCERGEDDEEGEERLGLILGLISIWVLLESGLFQFRLG